jgi:two-component system nitrogen regulation sensor histidine kinase NtrY
LFLQDVAHQQVDFALTATPEIGTIACDRHQFGQAMTNVLKNAVEAVEARAKDTGEGKFEGKVEVAMALHGDTLEIIVSDNGIGLPQDRERIIEPYVTSREKGTGLGLAIVNKIVEEHGGEMSFAASPSGGTRVTMTFARDPIADSPDAQAAE